LFFLAVRWSKWTTPSSQQLSSSRWAALFSSIFSTETFGVANQSDKKQLIGHTAVKVTGKIYVRCSYFLLPGCAG
ncbi:MAG: hypothetical protein V2I32_05130, partial [Desulforhopalus sp.]|nr:hypothetical protein [Desulforhopalus sp.]